MVRNMKAPNIHLDFLLYNGECEGLVKCTRPMDGIAAYRIPRMVADKCGGIADMKKSGVYLLIGEDANRNTTVYVGQGAVRANRKGVLGRMLESHTTKKGKLQKATDDWTEAIAFVSRLTDLDVAALSYLEHYLCKGIRDAGRVVVLNQKTPAISTFSEESECDMPRYMEQIEVLLRGLGLNILEPYQDNQRLTMKYKDGAGYGFNEGATFMLFKGSRLNSEPTATCPKSARRERQRMMEEGKIKDWVLQENIRMSSPSAAASFIGGASLNGWDTWKTKTGMTLKQYSGT